MTFGGGSQSSRQRQRFLKVVVERFDDIQREARSFCDQFVRYHCPEGADAQISRVAARFGLIAAAGEIARDAGIVPWPEGEAMPRTNLTAKQQRFTEEYLVDLNATQAARRAGYSARTAADIGRQLLRKAPVAERIRLRWRRGRRAPGSRRTA